jgi:MFS family permease
LRRPGAAIVVGMSTSPAGPAPAHQPATATTRPGAPRRERLALAVLLTASFTLAVDFSILNVALPQIGADVGFALPDLQWIATSFAVCAAGLTLFFGRTADLFGRRRQFLAGIALLGVASLVGGLADVPWLLLAARVAQGVATAAVTPAALSLITTSFAEGPLRDRALGLNGALMAAGFTSGAVLGGLFAGLVSWRWAFFVNVAVALAVLVVGPLVLRETREPRRAPLDAPGAVTVTLALAAGVYGLTQAAEHSWSAPGSWGALSLAAALVAVFVAIERRVAHPLVPLGILARRNVGWGNAAGLVAFATETSLVFLLTLYLQEVRGFGPLQTGFVFAVLGAGTVLGGMVGPRVIGALGGRRAMVLGLVVQAAATVPLAFLSAVPGWLAILLALAFVGGVANLVAIVGFMVTATAGLPDRDQGLATGLTTMSQQVGIALGTPVMSAVVTAVAHDGGTPLGLSVAITVNAGLALVAGLVLVAALRLSGRPTDA